MKLLFVGYRTVTFLHIDSLWPIFMPLQRRIEDRIRELCARAAAATDRDLEPALAELSQLLRGTIDHMRKRATSLLVERKRLLEPRRRANDTACEDPSLAQAQICEPRASRRDPKFPGIG